jgi:hypothetical protein
MLGIASRKAKGMYEGGEIISKKSTGSEVRNGSDFVSMCDVANAGEVDLRAGKSNGTREKESTKRKAMERKCS